MNSGQRLLGARAREHSRRKLTCKFFLLAPGPFLPASICNYPARDTLSLPRSQPFRRNISTCSIAAPSWWFRRRPASALRTLSKPPNATNCYLSSPAWAMACRLAPACRRCSRHERWQPGPTASAYRLSLTHPPKWISTACWKKYAAARQATWPPMTSTAAPPPGGQRYCRPHAVRHGNP